jgi:hypothetical protein
LDHGAGVPLLMQVNGGGVPAGAHKKAPAN